MTYYQFVQAVENQIKEGVDKKVSVQLHTALKNNGKMRRGLLLKENGVNISPAIYLEEYYQHYQKGVMIKDIAVDILQLYEEVKFSDSIEGRSFYSYQMLQDKIIYHLINREKNKKLLEDVPFMPYLDMAIVFYVLLDVNECGTATMLIKNEHLKCWNMDIMQIYKNACENTEKLLPYTFQDMNEVIAEISGNAAAKKRKKEEMMYVLSNYIRSFGAAAVLYKDVLKKIAILLNDDYYILPSSVHEVIVVPKSKAIRSQEFKQMVREINETQVDEEEVLSDNVYFYNRAEEVLTD